MTYGNAEERTHLVTVVVLVRAVLVDVGATDTVVLRGIDKYELQNAVAGACCFAAVTSLLTLEQNAGFAARFAGTNCAYDSTRRGANRMSERHMLAAGLVVELEWRR